MDIATSTLPSPDRAGGVPAWKPVLLGALAAGMGWGIRGQYGHETGAMIAGLLFSLTILLLYCPHWSSLNAARAAAWCTAAIGFGGAMTYGQTIGLTHDAPLIGNWAALRWGFIGLALKGGLWIGFAGAFLGMGLGRVKYRAVELAILLLALLGLFFAGVALFNKPFDPSTKTLPAVYFSDDWRWEPGADLKPRPEVWGGFLLALAGLIGYTAIIRRDPLATRLAGWGIIGGAIGFPLGQTLQAFHAWNPEIFRSGFWAKLDPCINWWNMMETSFGATFGAVLGLGVHRNRGRIDPAGAAEGPFIGAGAEWLLAAAHITLVMISEFSEVKWIDSYTEYSLVLGLIPIAACAGGRWWPFLLILPITLLPVAGKTVRQLVYREPAIDPAAGWALYLVLPVLAVALASLVFALRARAGARAGGMLRGSLLLAVWIYFGLNFAFFRYPWPWQEWTSRTPNAIIYMACAAGLTLAAILTRRDPRA